MHKPYTNTPTLHWDRVVTHTHTMAKPLSCGFRYLPCYEQNLVIQIGQRWTHQSTAHVVGVSPRNQMCLKPENHLTQKFLIRKIVGRSG